LRTPDVSIHHRGEIGPQHNFMIVEFKNVHHGGITNSADLLKVESWMELFSYRFGAVIAFGPSGKQFGPSGRWLRRNTTGKIVAENWLP
jgi:hypothetical protein